MYNEKNMGWGALIASGLVIILGTLVLIRIIDWIPSYKEKASEIKNTVTSGTSSAHAHATVVGFEVRVAVCNGEGADSGYVPCEVRMVSGEYFSWMCGYKSNTRGKCHTRVEN